MTFPSVMLMFFDKNRGRDFFLVYKKGGCHYVEKVLYDLADDSVRCSPVT